MNTRARGNYAFIRARFAEVCAEEVCYVSGNQEGKKNCIQMGTDAACPPAMGSNSQCRSMLDGYVIWAVNAAAAQHQQHDL